MTLLIGFYIIFGILAFLYELDKNYNWKFCLFIAIFYPVTMVAGLWGWFVFGAYYLIDLVFKGIDLLWQSRLYQTVRYGRRK